MKTAAASAPGRFGLLARYKLHGLDKKAGRDRARSRLYGQGQI